MRCGSSPMASEGRPVIPFPDSHVRQDDAELIAAEIRRERARRAARRVLDAEERGPAAATPQILTLRELLAEADDESNARWRIDGWLPMGARVVFAAQMKAGKT